MDSEICKNNRIIGRGFFRWINDPPIYFYLKSIFSLNCLLLVMTKLSVYCRLNKILNIKRTLYTLFILRCTLAYLKNYLKHFILQLLFMGICFIYNSNALLKNSYLLQDNDYRRRFNQGQHQAHGLTCISNCCV